jgi:tricorn protease-like protein
MNTEDFTHQLTFALESPCASLALSPNGELLATGGLEQNIVCIWNTRTGEKVNSWPTAPPVPYYCMKSPLRSLAISSDGLMLITGGRSLTAWELETGAKIRVFKGSSSYIGHVNISSDNNILVAENHNRKTGTLTSFWELKKSKKIRSSVHGYWLISPNCKILVGRDEDDYQSFKIWDLTTEQKLKVLHSKSTIQVSEIAFSRNGRLLAGGGTEGIMIWDVETGEVIQIIDKFKNIRFHEHLDNICSVVFSPDGNFLLSAGSDGLIQIWSINTGKNIHTLQGRVRIHHIYMSNDDQTLIGLGIHPVDFSQEIEVWATNI